VQIYEIMQEAYTVEAQLLGVNDFFPLKRTTQNIANSANQFFGCFKDNALLGVCELEHLTNDAVLIASMVVRSRWFRQGIVSSLVNYVLGHCTVSSIFVSTAENNLPAIKLYQKHGFILHDKEMLNDGMYLVKLCFTRIV